MINFDIKATPNMAIQAIAYSCERISRQDGVAVVHAYNWLVGITNTGG